MLRRAKELKGYHVRAVDGDVGSVHDVLVDDARWLVRYMVVESGSWIGSKTVLLSPATLGVPDVEGRAFSIDLTRREVEEGPIIDVTQPVPVDPAQGGATFGLLAPGRPVEPPTVEGEPIQAAAPPAGEATSVAHLRSLAVLRGFAVEALDGTIGRVDDVIVDDESWVVRYVVISRGRLRRRHIILPAAWINRVRWAIQTMSFDLERGMVESGPTYEPSKELDRDRERQVYDHYGQPKYWE